MKPFEYERAADTGGAIAALGGRPDAAYLAGGTNLVDHMKLGIASPELLVDVSRALDSRIDELPGGGLRIGAGVRNADLAADMGVRERYPALARALLAGASGQLRNLATTAGNLLQRTRCPYFQDPTTPCNKRAPGSGCSALDGYTRQHAILGASQHCVATHPSDMAVAMLAFDAVVRVQGPEGARKIAIADLHRLPDDAPQRDTTLEHGDLITHVELPSLEIAARSTYRKVRDRASYAFALVSVAAAEAGLRAAATTVDATYATPHQHQGAMEPHTSVALWNDDTLRLYESTQSVHGVRDTIAEVFGLRAEQVEVTAPFVGGGFGSKGEVHANAVLAVLAAQAVPGRPVKLALTRRQVFTLGSHRTPTIQRVRLGADASGGLLAITHDVWAHTSRVKAYNDQIAAATRMMYAAPSIATTHRLAPLDVPFPSWMRAPSEAPGMYALECAIDELAVALRIDPIELRIHNDPPADPDSGKPWSSRNLVACLRQGAERFGWTGRDPAPRRRRDGRWLAGTGVAGSTYPVFHTPGSQAQIEFRADARYEVSIGAMDVGTGTWTSLAQVAAEALGVPLERVALQIGDTALPYSHVPGGSAGITSWGATLFGAARAFRDRHGDDPAPGDAVTAGAPDNPAEEAYAMHAFGAHFAEVRVDADTGEVRVPRMLGMFAVGRVVNPRTARSQLIGGMTFGLSMALHEEVVMDAALGAIVTTDLASYHIAANADVGDIDAAWIDEIDPHVNPMGTKGIGEIGIVGSAAAIANAVFHATGIRVRDLPITPEKLLGARVALSA